MNTISTTDSLRTSLTAAIESQFLVRAMPTKVGLSIPLWRDDWLEITAAITEDGNSFWTEAEVSHSSRYRHVPQHSQDRAYVGEWTSCRVSNVSEVWSPEWGQDGAQIEASIIRQVCESITAWLTKCEAEHLIIKARS